MSTATLHFDLTDIDDQTDFACARSGKDLALAIWAYNNEYLRTRIRRDDTLSDDERAAYEAAQQTLLNYLTEYGIDLEKLVI